MLSILLLVACGAPESARPTDATAPIAWCDGATAQRYDPDGSVELEQWPDDRWTVADPGSPTGRRVSLAEAAWVPALNPVLAPIAAQLEGASGFHTQGRAVLRFTAPLGEVPSGSTASIVDPRLMLVDLSTSPPTRVPYVTELDDDGRQLRVLPLRPLTPGARHALIATTALLAADGGCIAPSATLRKVLDPSSTDSLSVHYASAILEAGLAPGEVSAATVWTTHLDHLSLVAAADAARQARFGWDAPLVCVDVGDWRQCDGSFTAADYRAASGEVAGDAPTATWTLPVRVLLPHGEGPFPVVVYGHGLNGSRGDAGSVMRQIIDLRVAVVAADALHHGDHPTATPGSAGLAALPFLGLDLENLAVDALALRGSFEQTTLDRLQLIALVDQAPDVDGDGRPDLDTTRLGYVGVSLGGLLGPPLIALSDHVQTAVLWVGGGHLISFALESEVMSTFAPLLESLAGGEAALLRLLPVAQSTVDPADPALWASLALERRPFGGPAPDVLLPVALHDTVVPPPSARALALGFGLTHAEPVAEPVDGLATAQAPLAANHTTGATAAYFQYDRVTWGDAVVAADHGNTPFAPESQLQLRDWLEAWLADEPSVAVDPYAALDTPALP